MVLSEIRVNKKNPVRIKSLAYCGSLLFLNYCGGSKDKF